MKKALCFILAAIMCLTLCACSSAPNKNVNLEDLVFSTTGITDLYVLKYDSDYEFENTTHIDQPSNGIVYVVGYSDGDFDVVLCNGFGKKLDSFNNDTTYELFVKNGMTSRSYWELKFITECLEGAMDSVVSAAEGNGEIAWNEWYCYSDAELEALLNGEKIPSSGLEGDVAGAADADAPSGAIVEDAPAAEAPAAESPAN